MKHILFFALFYFLLSTICAQNKILIKFRDGSEINGYGRIKVDNNILYKKDKDAEKKIYDYMTVRELIVFDDNTENHYEYKLVGPKDYEDFKLLKIVNSGEVTLYEEVFSGTTNPELNGGFRVSYTSVNYYISKNGSNRASSLQKGNTYSKRFKKIAANYFNDCPDLINKIESREYFDRYGIHSIVEYYNEKCK